MDYYSCKFVAKTVDALMPRAAALLKNGDNKRALAVCEQIIVLDPGRQFDASFWASAQAKR
jgi:hypothetical protein